MPDSDDIGSTVAESGLAAPRSPAPFVGRDVEIGRLARVLERLESESGGLVIVTGVAGVGKTRLVREFRAACAASGVSWYSAPARIESSGKPYSLLTELLVDVWDLDCAADDEHLAGHLKAACDSVLDQSADAHLVLGRLFGLRPPEAVAMEPGVWRDRLFEVAEQLMVRLSEDVPAVVCAEDLQWADASSVTLLRHLAHANHVDHARVLFVCTCRPPFELLNEAERAALGESHVELELQPLSLPEARELTRLLLGGGNAAGELELELAEASGGSPLKLEEKLRALVESGSLTRAGDGRILWNRSAAGFVPLTADDVIADRVRHLGNEARQVLGEAAIVGEVLPYRLLHDIASAPESLDMSLDVLERLGLLEEQVAGGQRSYAFRHDIVRQAAYSDLGVARRSGLHERLADVLESEYADQAQRISERLAFHYQRGLSHDKAIRYLLASAEKSVDQFAYDEAERFFEQSYRLVTASLGDAPESTALLLDTLNGWAIVCAERAEHGRVWEMLSPHLRTAESLDDPERLATFYVSLAAAEMGRGRFPEALEFSRKSAEIADRLGDSRLMAQAHNSLAWTQLELGDFDAVVRHGWAGHRASRTAAEAAGGDRPIRDLEWTTLNAVGLAHMYQGDVRGADGLADYVSGSDGSDPRQEIIALLCRGYARQTAGDYERAIAVYDEACEIIADPGWMAVAQFYRCVALIDAERTDEAEQILRVLWEQCRDRFVRIEFYVQMQLGLCLAVSGAVRDGIAMIREAADSLERYGCVSQLAIAALLLGKAHRLLVTRVLDGDASVVRRAGVPGVVTLDDAAREAERWSRLAVERADLMGARFVACEASIDLSQLMAMTGRTGEARRWAERALRDAQERDANGFCEQALAVLARVS